MEVSVLLNFIARSSGGHFYFVLKLNVEPNEKLIAMINRQDELFTARLHRYLEEITCNAGGEGSHEIDRLDNKTCLFAWNIPYSIWSCYPPAVAEKILEHLISLGIGSGSVVELHGKQARNDYMTADTSFKTLLLHLENQFPCQLNRDILSVIETDYYAENPFPEIRKRQVGFFTVTD